jgi:hypothetical protein
MALSNIPGAPSISHIPSVAPECWAKWVGNENAKASRHRFGHVVSRTERFNPQLQCRITSEKYQGRTLVLPHHVSNELGL